MDRDRVNRRMISMVDDIEAHIRELESHPKDSVLRNEDKIAEWKAKVIDHRLFIYCCRLPDILGRKVYNAMSSKTPEEQENYLIDNSPYLGKSSDNKPTKIGNIRI